VPEIVKCISYGIKKIVKIDLRKNEKSLKKKELKMKRE